MPQNEPAFGPAPGLPRPVRGILLSWAQWDSFHYRAIAVEGYVFPEQKAAFFPLYPYLARLVHLVLPGDTRYSLLLVTNVAALVALVLLHRLVTFEAGPTIGGRATFYLAAFPFGFFLHVAYTESLFIALAVGALYCMRRNRWWAAGCLAGLASGTRSPGIILLAVLGFEYLRQRGFRPSRIRFDAAAVLLAPAGMVAYAGYCWVRFGNPTQFSASQKAWNRTTSMPWTTLWHGVTSLNDRPFLASLQIYNSVDVLFTLAGIVLMLLATFGPLRLRPDQCYLVVYGWLNLVILLCFPIDGGLPMNSFPRYLITLVPLFMVLARLGARRGLEQVYLMGGIGMQAIWASMFINGIWAG
jgi:hypothetical protein